jgi:PAS domain S-box-containing protein
MYPQDTHWYEELFDAVHQFVAILDDHGKIIKANQAASELTGLDQSSLNGSPLWDIPWSILTKLNRREIKRAVIRSSKGEFVRDELEIRPRNRPALTIDFTFKPILGEDKAIKFVIAEGRDISFYKRTSEALYQSRARFATIFEKAGLGIVIEAPDGKIIDCNPAFLAMLGYQAEEVRQHVYLDITHPMDRTNSRKLFNELVGGKRDSYSLVKRYLSKTGQPVWASINTSLVRGTNRKAQFVIVMAENINAQKEAEAEVSELRQRLMQGREMERLRLAQDLHDGPLQEIIGISYQVKELENMLEGEANLEQLKAVNLALQKVAKSIRTICGELRPSTLMPFGLEKAILSHSEEFQAAHPELPIELNLVHDGQALPEQVRIALFRIYQEALNNVLRHAQADKVSVRFWLDDGHASLEVEDNGKGFSPPNHWIELARNQHLGLVGSIERAREAGGHLDVSSSSGKGTLIRAVLPVHKETDKDQVVK